MNPYPVDQPLPRPEHVTIDFGGQFSVVLQPHNDRELKVSLFKGDMLLCDKLEPKQDLELAARLLCKRPIDRQDVLS